MHFNASFACLHFSDIHGSNVNFRRIVSLANHWKDYLSCVINTRDTVEGRYPEYIGWYYNIITASNVDILTCLGNHDANGSSAVDSYKRYIKPTIDSVSVIVQPENAQNGKCYYYKDYSNVRVIVTDAYTPHSFYDETEKIWLQSVLSDAKNNNLSVICCVHASASSATRIPCTFQSVYGLESWHTVDSAFAVVQEFIDGGGKFVCWLCGHTHWDNFVTPTAYPDQPMFVTMSARYDYGPSAFDTARSKDVLKKDFDCFNYIALDAQNKLLKVMRIGVNLDYKMQTKNVLVYDSDGKYLNYYSAEGSRTVTNNDFGIKYKTIALPIDITDKLSFLKDVTNDRYLWRWDGDVLVE